VLVPVALLAGRYWRAFIATTFVRYRAGRLVAVRMGLPRKM
jgi:hypothetical protein